MKKEKILLETVYGHKMYLPKDLIPYQQGELQRKKIYEPATSEVIMRILRPGMRVAECGANCGYHALNIAKVIGATGKLYCFEANPELIEYLQENLELNGYSDYCSVINKGIWSHNTSMPFPILATGQGGASFKNEEQLTRQDTRVVNIPVVSLDSFFDDEPVDLLRMDIEGAEIEALKGASGLLEVNEPTLIFEWTPENSGIEESTEIFHLLKSHGYKVYRISNYGLIEMSGAHEFHYNYEDLCRHGQRDVFCSKQIPVL